MVDWPTNIDQQCNLLSLGEEDMDMLLAFKPDFGADKRRLRSTMAVALITYERTMTTSSWDLLQTFYRVTLKNGALAFNRLHPRTQAAIVCEFMEKPKAKPQSHEYMLVAISLLVLPINAT